jgi:hypothetical protein
MRIGVISDTHNFLDPRVPELFAGVDQILHAGDIGLPWLLLELERIAPVTAVVGNTDAGLPQPETAWCELAGRRFLLQHIVDPDGLSPALATRIQRDRPHVVVFGHTHRPFERIVDGVLFFNPGYAGKPRFNQPRSLAILHCGPKRLSAEYLAL